MGALIGTYLPPLGIAALIVAVALSLLALFARRQRLWAQHMWRGIVSHAVISAVVVIVLFLSVGLFTYAKVASDEEDFRTRERQNLFPPGNLLADPSMTRAGPLTSTLTSWVTNGPVAPNGMPDGPLSLTMVPHQAITSSTIVVAPESTYRYSIDAISLGQTPGQVQIRMLWLDTSMDVSRPVGWDDTPPITASNTRLDSNDAFHTGAYKAPAGATRLRVIVTNSGSAPVDVGSARLSQDGVYVEQHPNGTLGALAFSFDWESAMGGAIHSKGMVQHDPAGAAQHGMEMRQGADWLSALFKKYGIRATFYATGYNLLDGNTEHRTFSGNPIYKWASPKNRWASDWWLTHPWYGDDPFGTYQTQPAWYFGDQTRALLQAGDQIEPHTFGHLYVRGSNPKELATDMDEWYSAAKAFNINNPTTFAFPWRSSNSLTADFYDVLYSRGIRSVTRLYEGDLQDLYTVGAVKAYPNMLVMPDFLLGSPSAVQNEEAGGAGLGLEDGMTVIEQTIARRGTTSFWQHPEQLASDPSLKGVRDTWEGVVQYAAQVRDAGGLWIAPVGEIMAYQRDVVSVTASLEQGLLGIGGWKIAVHNGSGKTLQGVTLTLPGNVVRASSGDTDVLGVSSLLLTGGTVQVKPISDIGQPVRQLVLKSLKPGDTTVDIDWAAGQEPVH